MTQSPGLTLRQPWVTRNHAPQPCQGCAVDETPRAPQRSLRQRWAGGPRPRCGLSNSETSLKVGHAGKVNMKQIKSLLLIPLLFAISFGATNVALVPQTEKELQSIRQSYAAINRKQARYRKVKKELSGFSAEGGVLTTYFEGPNIVKILATYYGEMGRTNEEFYYREGKLIFVLRTELNYNRPLSGKVVSRKVSRFYFHDNKLIRWIDESGKTMPSDSAEYQEQQKDNLDTSKKLVEGARSSNKTI